MPPSFYRFILFISIAYLPIHVLGASFDCGLTTLNNTEQFICKEPEVSKLDEKMALVYAENFKKLSPANRVSYLNGQRDWLKYWPQACKRSYNQEQDTKINKECAVREYEDRLKLLPVKELKNQWVVFNVARYSAIKADKAFLPDWVNTVHHSLVYPKIETMNLSASELAQAQQINDWISAAVKKLGLKNRISLNEKDMDSFLDIDIEAISPDLTGLKTRYYFNGFGAHGNYAFSNFHYSFSKQRELRENDILQGPWKKTTAEKIFEKLKAEYKEMVLVDSAKDVEQSIARTQSWQFNKKELTFVFNPYELTAYAAGAPEISMDWQELSTFLTDYVKAQIPQMY
jgi:uncharacterized protein